jgi:hypothetical protein
MGGYLAFEMRQAGHQIALLNTPARPDTAEQAQRRRVATAAGKGRHHGREIVAERGKLDGGRCRITGQSAQA